MLRILFTHNNNNNKEEEEKKKKKKKKKKQASLKGQRGIRGQFMEVT